MHIYLKFYLFFITGGIDKKQILNVTVYVHVKSIRQLISIKLKSIM